MPGSASSSEAVAVLTLIGPAPLPPEAVDEALRILREAPPESFEIKEMRTTITALELRRELLDLTGREAP